MLTSQIETFIREEIEKSIIQKEQAENDAIRYSLNKDGIPHVYEFVGPNELANAAYQTGFAKAFPNMEKLPKNIMFRVLLNIIKNCIYYIDGLKKEISDLSAKLMMRQIRDDELLRQINRLEVKNNQYDLKIQKLQSQIEMLEIKTSLESYGDY